MHKKPAQALRLFLIWDTESVEEVQDQVVERLFTAIEADDDDSRSGDQKRSRAKGKKRSKSSSSSSSPSSGSSGSEAC